MTPTPVDPQARLFFDEFVEAFRSFDGGLIAQRFLAPYLAFTSADKVQVFTSRAETAAYFQRIVDGYYAQGCRACRYKDLAVTVLDARCVVGTVTWELLAEDGSLRGTWRESYNLCRVDDRFMVYASTDHAG